MNMKEIKEMLQLMADHDLAEFELDKDGLKVKLKKMQSVKMTEHAPMAHSVPPTHPTQQATHAPAKPAVAEGADTVIVRSPMVGTYYSAPAPDQPAYLTIGARVKEGDVICIIEAMKLMNEIKSDISGEVIEILVKNGQPIEFDQPLFKIKK